MASSTESSYYAMPLCDCARAAMAGGRARPAPSPMLGDLRGAPRRRFGYRGLLGLNVAAAPTCPQLEASVEALEGGLQLLLDVDHVHGDGVELRMAAIAEPEE